VAGEYSLGNLALLVFLGSEEVGKWGSGEQEVGSGENK